jgi:hypothetical protein
VQWQVNRNNGFGYANIHGATSTTYSFTALPADNGYEYQAVFSNTFGPAATAPATLTVEIPVPTITTNPLSQILFVGQLATFTAAATGTPTPNIQWQVNRNNGYGFVNIAGETSSTYSFTTTVADSGYQYQAVFSNSYGGTATTSAATLTVSIPEPVVTLNPVNQDVYAGHAVTFTAAATGTPTPTVQWQVNRNDGFGFVNVGARGSATYSFTTVASQNGYEYQAVFSNAYGGTATTTPATLTVSTVPVVTINPLTQTVIVGQPVTLTAAATGNPAPSVQWQASVTGAANSFIDQPSSPFTQGSGVTTGTFTIFGNSTFRYFRAVFTNSDGTTTASATTAIAVLTFIVPPPSPQIRLVRMFMPGRK